MSVLLSVDDLHVSYGGIAALKGVSISIDDGELVAIVGPNGAGKSTLLRTIAGLNVPRQGSLLLRGKPIIGLAPERLVADGISLVPEGRHIFGSLTVEENIRLGVCFRSSKRVSANGPGSSPGASSRCLRLPAPSWPHRDSCCSTSLPWVSRR